MLGNQIRNKQLIDDSRKFCTKNVVMDVLDDSIATFVGAELTTTNALQEIFLKNEKVVVQFVVKQKIFIVVYKKENKNSSMITSLFVQLMML